MATWSGLALAVVALVAPLRAQQSPGDADPSSRLRNMQASMQRVIAEAAPYIPRLRLMASKYGNEESLGALDGDRRLLRDQLGASHDALKTLGERYRKLARQHYAHLLASGVMSGTGPAGREGEATAAPGTELDDPLALEAFFERSNEFRKEIRTALSNDETEYQRALARLAERRSGRRLVFTIAGNLAAVVILLLGFWWVRSRPKQEIVRVITADSAPAGAPATPAPGALAAIGPAASGMILGGNYRLQREIGRGGMGVVYEATDLTLERKVAVKAMREELLQQAPDMELFLTEARLVAALKHPNVVEIHNVLRDGGRVYLVFEFVTGRSLDGVLRERGPLPLRAIKGILAHIASALDYAHSRRVIHRDLKPSNIMITDERTVKVMDFGIAHQAKVTAARLTNATSWGSPPYMAPEQELGSVSKESDLYALGVCLYELAIGRLPFPGPNFLAQKRELRFVPPSKAHAALPGALDAVVARVLEPDPARRFHSASELAAAVAAVPDA